MTTERKFFRRVFRFEVLSEERLNDDFNLSELDQMTDTGDCVGRFLSDGGSRELDGRAMADALYAAGSEPGFFQLDDAGNDVDGENNA